MAHRHAKLTFKSTKDTSDFAQMLGAVIGPGDTVLLSGAIGSGKTFFARALIQSLLDEPEDVPSPTFTLVQTYETERGEIWHSDLYRLTSSTEVEELGLLDAFETAICLIEWPDRLGSAAPQNALTLDWKMDLLCETGRDVHLWWTHNKWEHLLSDLLGNEAK